MQIIRCTQKLLKSLKPQLVEVNDQDQIFSGWHANLFHVQRRRCVLITHDRTLFTMFIPVVTKFEFQHFDKIFRDSLFDTLNSEGFSQKQIEAALIEHDQIVFGKSNNRSVLGSMNDQKYVLEYYLAMHGGLYNISLLELNKHLNRNILRAIDMNHPIEMLRKALAGF